MTDSIAYSAAQAVATSPLFASANFDPNALTPEGLLIYLRTRLGALDTQIKEVMDTEKNGESVRSEIRALQAVLRGFDTKTNKDETVTPVWANVPATLKEIDDHLANIAKLEPKLAETLKNGLHSSGQVLGTPKEVVTGSATSTDAEGQEVTSNVTSTSFEYTTAQLEASNKFLDDTTHNLESTSQMNMIGLQSLMSARQTAIQLATGMIASFNDSQKAIASNIR